MFQDERDLCRFKPRVDGDGDQSGFKLPVEKLDSWNGVGPMDGDAITRLKALSEKPLRQVCRRFVEISVRHPDVAAG